jgi:purine nucleosidase
METVPVVLDTDIGTDVDDIVALAVLLRSPAIDLRAVTTVYVNAALRAQMVRAVLALAGRSGIPVGPGVDLPLLQRDALFWEGWEGEGVLDRVAMAETPLPHAVDLLIETVMAHPGEVTVLAIGPLTNIALAILREPRFAAAARRLVIMGGRFQRGFEELASPYAEHNIRCDPEAAQIVLASGAAITLVPLDVTLQVRIRREDLPRIATSDALGAVVADQLARYMTGKGRDWTYMHDPLAAAGLVRPSFLQTHPLQVGVETRGDLTRGQTVGVRAASTSGLSPADVALQVDVAAFQPWLVDLLANAAP